MKVTIEITRKTRYARIVEMTKEEYDRLSGLLDGERKERKEAEKEIDEMIEEEDWQDDELDYVDTFQTEDEE